ncbi:MAG: dihydropteroate synthase [Syntrophomonadaceae bacterium]|jgi:dihydropteroate synthase|nr:dihydropteroate synthase [Syntrophomonadaceae bacterium]
MQGHYAVKINDLQYLHSILDDIEVDAGSYEYLLPKGMFHCIKLKRIPCRAALIIKQEMLSKGGEAAISRNTLTLNGFSEGHTDVLLMGTKKHYQRLTEKLKVQQFGLKNLADEIADIIDNSEQETLKLTLAGGKTLYLGKKTLIMGILNVTPDSFSDGGLYNNCAEAVNRALEMAEEGADIIDVGGVSSRPEAELADERTELRRLLPVLERLKTALPESVLVSVDTFRAKVAEECLKAGADIINDIGRLQMDKRLKDVIGSYKAPAVLMHNRMHFDQDRVYDDLIADIIGDLSQSIGEALASGVRKEQIIIDPGLGFGKDLKQNCMIIKHLADFKSLGRPILIGASRKSFIGGVLEAAVDQRLEGSLAAAAASIMNGANIIRVHDVKASKQMSMMLDMVNKNER